MPWGKLDDALHRNAKVWSFSHGAFRVWVYAISYCNEKRRTDPTGTLSATEARTMCGLAGVGAAAVRELVAKGGLDVAGDGFVVHDFDKYAPATDATAAERKRRQRALERNGHAPEDRDVTPSSRVTSRVTGAVTPVTKETHVPCSADALPHGPPASTHTEHLPQQETMVAVLTTPPAAAVPSRAPPSKQLEPSYSPEFEAWWAAYPRKREKFDAYGAYQKTVKAGAKTADLLAAAVNYAAAEAGGDDQFVKLPATFLGPKRPWLDFRHGVPAARASPAANGPRRPNAFEQIDREVARLKGDR